MRWVLPEKPLRPRTIVARRLRRDSTDVEKRFWRALREAGFPERFRRQHPIGNRIADFACPAQKLVIELDGGQHDSNSDADDARSTELAHNGYRVIRFWNNEVIENLPGVRQTIRQSLDAAPPHPNPLQPKGRRGS
jgi:very-short-patch-repair endonuclease